ncbi:MAG: hypothetical protein L6R38_004938 [Xanthoria sp. 2 TBL-2021]|nr:MAG: hypothetical protein L6R38_004938 [Xanthoria sp. 2 TBL-2021]
MSNQVQIFWDPYLEALVYETPNQNPPSVPPPAVVTPDEFQAPPTTVATFLRNPNAPLGSFHNPHLDPSSTEAGVPPHLNMATPAASVHPQATIQWQPDPSAPLGSYWNAHPYAPPSPATPAAAPPTPLNVLSQQYDQPNHQMSLPTQPTWQEDFARMFNSMNLNSPVSDPPVQAQPAANWSATAEAPSIQAATPNPLPPRSRHRHRPRSRSNDRSSGRHVRFADEGARIRANTQAAMMAALRAEENEMETREYIDALTVIPPRRHRRRPTPMPPPTISEPEPPQSRSSSTASTIDPLTTRGAPIPAAPSRNPGFHDPRREVPPRTGRSEMAEVGTHEMWPRCTVCEDRPATIRKFGIEFCEGCYGQALVAEERRGRSRERR